MWRNYKYIKNWILQRKVEMKADLMNGCQHIQDYMRWIKAVKDYKEAIK